MLSLIMLHTLNQQQAQRAVTDQLLLLVIEAEDKQSGDRLVTHLRRMPNLGSHRPTGWTLGRTLRVDAAYAGQRGKDALTFFRFLAAVRVGCGYAVLQGGRYCEVGEFTRQNSGKRVARRTPKRQPEVR